MRRIATVLPVSGAYLPVTPAVRDRVNEWLAGMAARGFVAAEADIRRACRTRPEDMESKS